MISDMDVLGARAEALFADLGHFSVWTIRVCQLLLPFYTPCYSTVHQKPLLSSFPESCVSCTDASIK